VIAFESANLFHNLAPGEVGVLRAIMQERRFGAGHEILGEGGPGDGIYIVKDGFVEISGRVSGRERRVFSRLGPGEMFGEMAVIEQRPCSATVTAVQDTIVFFLPRDEMLALLQSSPGLAFNVLREISRRLREFDQLHLREVVQEERLAAVGSFAHSIIHDLKTPLTIIGLSSEVACRPDATPEKRAQAQDNISKQIRRITDMVNDVLEFTRGRQSDGPLPPVVFSDFISKLLPDLQAEARTKSARIELQTGPPAVKLPLDPRRMCRVFFNLVHNAADMMPNGGRILLRFRAGQKEVVSEIEDTGPGIAPEIAGSLFEPFVTFGKARGTGLGLSICKKIVEDHHGRIWARSEPGHGAIFCFSLPLAE
jgi:signal transduction histidine kinase